MDLATFTEEINYDKILVFHYFQKLNKGHLKVLNVNYEKWPDFAILLF